MFCRLSDSFYRVAFLVLVRCGGLSWAFSSFVGAGYGAFCLWSLVLKAVSSSLGSGKFCSPVFICGHSPLPFISFVFYPLRVVRTRLWSFFLFVEELWWSAGYPFLGLSVGARAPCFFCVVACCVWPLAISHCLHHFSSAWRSFAALGLICTWMGVLRGTLEVVGILSVGSWRRGLSCLALFRLWFLAFLQNEGHPFRVESAV